jgi:myo-inositol-1(or 4)-monophosphatase
MESLLKDAGHELSQRVGGRLGFQVKSDTSIVTEADLASEKAIISKIRSHYPDDVIYSEEAGLSHSYRIPGDFIWIIDPLDGTTNFANGYPFYCVSIGRGRFNTNGAIEVIEAGILDGARSRMYYAKKGQGAYVDRKPIRVAQPRDFNKNFLVTGFYYMQGPELLRQIERFARVAEKCQTVRRDGAAALDLALVAEGIFDAFWETGLQPWDVAAGSLLVTEAGGQVRNYFGQTESHYDIESPGIIAGVRETVETIRGLL